jgi:hypothetical protein
VSPSDEQQRFALINAVVVPVWIAMIAAPRSRLTAWIVERSDLLLVGISATYAVHLARAFTTPIDLTDARAVRTALSTPDAFLAGWMHFASLDLFVGRWIWATALREQRSCRLALLLTMMVAPVGLGVFTLQRRLRPVPRAEEG